MATWSEKLLQAVLLVWLAASVIGLLKRKQPHTAVLKRSQHYLFILSLVYFFHLVFIAKSGFDSLYFGVYDFTGISSVVSGYLAGYNWLHSPFYVSPNGNIFFLAHHFSPALALFSPFYLFFNSHLLYGYLLALVFLLFLLTLWIFLMPFDLGNMEKVLLFLGFLFYPVVYYQSISFHFEMLVLPFSMLLFRGLKTNNTILLASSFLLLLAVKEDISLYFIFFSVYLATNRDYRKQGLWLLQASLVWFLFANIWLLPNLSGASSSFLSYWQLGNTIPQAIANIVTHPQIVADAFLRKSDVLLRIFAPLLFMPLLNPKFSLLVFFPLLAIHFLSQHIFFGIIEVYYSYTILPFILFATVENMQQSNLYLQKKIPHWPGLLLPLLLLYATVSAAAQKKSQPFLDFPAQKAGPLLQQAIEQIPANATLHTGSYLLGHSKVRNKALFYTDTSLPYQYLLFDSHKHPIQHDQNAEIEALLSKSKQFGKLVFANSRFSLYVIPGQFEHKFR